MSLDDLPTLPPLIHAEAKGYAERALAATREVQSRSHVMIDIQYGDDYWQKLDVYLPGTPASAPLPCLVFFHGGAWTNGTKEWMGFMAPPLLALPAIFVAANYRLAPTVRHPQQLEDCLAAVSWVHRNLAQIGGDPKRLFVGGHSAGGHLAALAALHGPLRARTGLPANAIRGCLPISGSYDLRNRQAAAGTSARRIYEMVLARETDDEDASPIAHVGPSAPPFLLAWGEKDFPHLVQQAADMTRALADAGIPVETLEIADADHFAASERCGLASATWTSAALAWLSGTRF
ncbi:MAG: alpha/beta hydrolase [Alphaproteobacteria bacterium]|nr:alpha/beta hydrolase [Alphaproteobacteria bacterium]